jgi:hypothetical protein
VAGNGGAFTAGNAAAPEGTQVLFLQGKSSVSQAMTLAAGTYAIAFNAAPRGNGGGAQTFRVLVDGVVVGTFNDLAGQAYSTLTTSSFTVAAGVHTIAFQGTNLRGGDNTAFIDQVTVVPQPAGLTDSGLELPALTAGTYAYAPVGSPWAFAGPAGVASNGSAFTAGNPAAPQGGQVAFVQGTGSMSQAVTFAAGTYTIAFNAAQRGNGGGAQTFRVLVDGVVVGTFNTLKGTAYATLSTGAFTVDAGSHIVTIQGTNLKGGDNTAFIDRVTVVPQ